LRVRDLIKTTRDEVPEELHQEPRQPLIEATGRARLTCSSGVAMSEGCEYSALSCGNTVPSQERKLFSPRQPTVNRVR
jgi:hypothetical protein